MRLLPGGVATRSLPGSYQITPPLGRFPGFGQRRHKRAGLRLLGPSANALIRIWLLRQATICRIRLSVALLRFRSALNLVAALECLTTGQDQRCAPKKPGTVQQRDGPSYNGRKMMPGGEDAIDAHQGQNGSTYAQRNEQFRRRMERSSRKSLPEQEGLAGNPIDKVATARVRSRQARAPAPHHKSSRLV